MPNEKKYRLLTNSDFDGLVCGLLFKSMGIIDEIKFAHPNEIQDEKIPITDRDIIASLPYSKNAHLVFNHRPDGDTKSDGCLRNFIKDSQVHSSARVVYDYYGGKNNFPHISEEIIEAADIADTAKYNVYDILYPEKWTLLNFIMDTRTGLDKFHKFKDSNNDLILFLIDYITGHSIDEVLLLPNVKERVDAYFKYEPMFNKQLNRCSTVYDNVVVIDLHQEEVVYPGNRFTIYTFYPKCNASLHILQGLNKEKLTLAVGKSIFNRTSPVDLGELMARYGGGGHFNAGGCQVDVDKADGICREIIKKINELS